MTQTERLILRARDAVAHCLDVHLSVPSIWFGAPWPGPDDRVDILAIDRAGTGDVHVVKIAGGSSVPKKAVEELMIIPGQFRWIALTAGFGEPRGRTRLAPDYLYPCDDMGRIGVIEYFRKENDDLGARIRYRAERFRGNLSKEADAFLASHQPDIEVR